MRSWRSDLIQQDADQQQELARLWELSAPWALLNGEVQAWQTTSKQTDAKVKTGAHGLAARTDFCGAPCRMPTRLGFREAVFSFVISHLAKEI